MRVFIFILLLVAAVSCKTPTPVDPSNVFYDQAGQTKVVITLSDYHLESLAQDIGALKDVKQLLVYSDKEIDGTYNTSPVEVLLHSEKPPFKKLPASITSLENLTVLCLIDMDLKSLPDDFGRLENLDSLSLSMNKLNLAQELEKLKKLKNLKWLSLYGNVVDTADLHELKRAIPNAKILSDFDE